MSTDQLRPLTELQALESESIHIIREVAATFSSPIMLFSGGKDSVVMVHLAAKAFWPAPIPFGLLHVDTGHNFPEVLQFRDQAVEFYGASIKIAAVQDYIDDGRLRERPDGTRNPLQTLPLLDAITAGRHDAVFGGGRRDEERARAKERVFSMRDEFGQWEPRNQRPELWSLYNGRHLPGEHVRVFPLSNWTELDVWDYIAAEKINLPTIYYAHEREVTLRDGMWIAITEVTPARAERRGGGALRALPHRRGHVLHRRRTVRGQYRARRDHRGRAEPADRARRNAGRRPAVRGCHGRSKAGGLLLMPLRSPHLASRPQPHRWSYAAPAGHRRLGRRRQVDPGRPAALRHQLGACGHS